MGNWGYKPTCSNVVVAPFITIVGAYLVPYGC